MLRLLNACDVSGHGAAVAVVVAARANNGIGLAGAASPSSSPQQHTDPAHVCLAQTGRRPSPLPFGARPPAPGRSASPFNFE